MADLGCVWLFDHRGKVQELYGTLWNVTNFTFCWTICRHCIAGLATLNTFPH